MLLGQILETPAAAQFFEHGIGLLAGFLGFRLGFAHGHEQDVAHLDPLGILEAVLVLRVVQIDLRIRDFVIALGGLGADRQQLERPTLRMAVAQLVGFVVFAQLLWRRHDLAPHAGGVDRCPFDADAVVLLVEALLELVLGHADAVGHQLPQVL